MPNTKRIFVILNFSVLLCFVFHSTLYSQVLKESSYFPLQIGNQWFFSSQNDTLSESVIDTQRIGGNLYFLFEKFRDFPGFLFRIIDNQVYIFADTSEYLWYDFKADSGDSWIVPLLDHPYNGGVFTLQSKTDTVVTPLESFTDCYRIHHHIGADAEFMEWFAPGVGIVKRDVITIAGLRRWVLVDRIITSVRTSRGFVIPKLHSLSQNYPNPFNPTTTIRYQLPETGSVKIILYNVLGQRVKTLVNEELNAGYHEVIWNSTNEYGSEVASGIYIYRMQTGDFVDTKKLILLR